MTTFEEVIGYIRAALQDTDCDNYQYSNGVLNQQIRFEIITLNNSSIYAEGTAGSFDDNLTSAEKAKIALRIAIRLLLGNSSEFSYKTPVHSITRKNSQQSRLAAFLQGLLDDVSGGKFAIAVDTDFNALVKGFDRYLNSLNTADTAWVGD